jgi:FkbM family methyltransferase
MNRPRQQNSVWRLAQVDRLCDHTFLPGLLDSNSIVIDLGANRGEFARELIRRFGCRVHAAEPLPCLCADIPPSPRLTLYPIAIGGRNGRARLNVFSSRCASLLASRENEATVQKQDVKVLDLHSLLALVGAEHIDLMKVDVEGAELEMFESALASDLERIALITIEFHDSMYPEHRPRVEAIKRWLQSIGFRVINFSLDNTDVLFINRAAGINAFEYCTLKYIAKYVEGGKRMLHRLVKGWSPGVSI